MRYLLWIVKLAVFLVLLGFALKNTDPVTVRYYLGMEWEAPLIIVALAFFVAGIAIGMLASMTNLYKVRRQVFALKKQLRLAEKTNPPEVESRRIADQS